MLTQGQDNHESAERTAIRLRININGGQRYRYEYAEKGHRIYPSPGGDICSGVEVSTMGDPT